MALTGYDVFVPLSPECESAGAPARTSVVHLGGRMQKLIDTVFSLSPDVRYVAVYRNGLLQSAVRPGIHNTSADESDKYEELIVNPTLLTLVRQRGEIDCGGAQFVIVRYGHFYQVVAPSGMGHISVSIEPHGDPLAVAGLIVEAARETSYALPVAVV